MDTNLKEGTSQTYCMSYLCSIVVVTGCSSESFPKIRSCKILPLLAPAPIDPLSLCLTHEPICSKQECWMVLTSSVHTMGDGQYKNRPFFPLLYRPAFVLLIFGALCELTECLGDRCDLLASSIADSKPLSHSQAGMAAAG